MSSHAPCARHNAQPKCALLSRTSLYMPRTNPNSGHTGRLALPPSIALHLHPTISQSANLLQASAGNLVEQGIEHRLQLLAISPAMQTGRALNIATCLRVSATAMGTETAPFGQCSHLHKVPSKAELISMGW